MTFTATVSPPPSGAAPTGTASFYDSGVLLGIGTLTGGIATLTTSALTIPGPHAVTAVYSGGGPYNGSTSPVLVETVTGGAPTTTTLVSSQNPSVSGDSVTFTATVSVTNGLPTGIVTFKDGAATLGTAPLAGGAAAFATSALGVGTHCPDGGLWRRRFIPGQHLVPVVADREWRSSGVSAHLRRVIRRGYQSLLARESLPVTDSRRWR